MSLSICEEESSDRDAIRDVIRRAFGSDEEVGLVDALRAEGYARLSLVAKMDGKVVGHLLFSALEIITCAGPMKALALAPMAVLPDYQNRGIGKTLVRAGLKLCAERGHRTVLVVGHPDYYPRFGFSATLAERLSTPYTGAAFMALELVPGALEDVQGEVRYPPPFDALS